MGWSKPKWKIPSCAKGSRGYDDFWSIRPLYNGHSCQCLLWCQKAAEDLESIGIRSLGLLGTALKMYMAFQKMHMAFRKSVKYGTRTNKFSRKKLHQFSILEKSHLSFCPGCAPSPAPVGSRQLCQEPLCWARRRGKTLPSAMPGGSRSQQPAGAGEEGAMAKAAPGTSRGVRAPGLSRGATLLPPKISTCVGKLRFRDSLLFLNRYHRFLSSLDSWLTLIWFSFSKDNENSWLPNKKV